MKRILCLIISIVIALLSLTACSCKAEGDMGTGNSEGNENNNQGARKIELTVWESTGGPDEFIRQAGERYTDKNPNVTIKYVNVELGDTSSQIALDGPAGIGPDLFVAPHDKIGELAEGGHIMKTRNSQLVKDKAIDVCADAVTYKNEMYGYPVAAETYALFYNKSIVDTPPQTFEELVKFCKNYNSENKYGLMFDVANAYYTIIFATSNGNRPLSDTDSSSLGLDNSDAIEGMTYFQSLRKQILDVPAADITTAVADEAFRSGLSAMHITGPWNLATYRDAGLEFGVAPLPSLPGETTPPASFSGTRTMFVSAYSEHPEEAADFAEFLMSEEIQKLRYELTEAIPSIDLKLEDEHIDGFIRQLEYSYAMPSIPAMGKFWDAMNSASANIWDGADVKKELEACTKAINEK